jgi:hypothetical protein
MKYEKRMSEVLTKVSLVNFREEILYLNQLYSLIFGLEFLETIKLLRISLLKKIVQL